MFDVQNLFKKTRHEFTNFQNLFCFVRKMGGRLTNSRIITPFFELFQYHNIFKLKNFSKLNLQTIIRQVKIFGKFGFYFVMKSEIVADVYHKSGFRFQFFCQF